MPPRICTSCEQPHVTTDWYEITEFDHPQQGEFECAPAHENRVRRETRGDVATFSLFGHLASIAPASRRVRYIGPGKAA